MKHEFLLSKKNTVSKLDEFRYGGTEGSYFEIFKKYYKPTLNYRFPVFYYRKRFIQMKFIYCEKCFYE